MGEGVLRRDKTRRDTTRQDATLRDATTTTRRWQAVGDDDGVTQQRDTMREREATHKGTRRDPATTTNTTTNRGAMGDDVDATINYDAKQETATTR